MKAIHLTAYGNPAQSLMMVEVSEPNAPSASEALVRMEYAQSYADYVVFVESKAKTYFTALCVTISAESYAASVVFGLRSTPKIVSRLVHQFPLSGNMPSIPSLGWRQVKNGRLFFNDNRSSSFVGLVQ